MMPLVIPCGHAAVASVRNTARVRPARFQFCATAASLRFGWKAQGAVPTWLDKNFELWCCCFTVWGPFCLAELRWLLALVGEPAGLAGLASPWPGRSGYGLCRR